MDQPSAPRPAVAIIGAGFSGTITALHLLRALPPEASILLCERAPLFGRGAAYATEQPDHLLNVRASNMSAFPDQPDGFDQWLRTCCFEDTTRVHDTPVGRFASRALYGRYLGAMLDLGLASVAGTARLRLVTDEVVDLEPSGSGWTLHFASGAAQDTGSVILAVGNLTNAARDTALYRSNPWSPSATADLRPGLPVLLVGTGLTAIDLVVSLHGQGFGGPIIALSRRGLLPQEHRPAPPWPTPAFTAAERASLLSLLRRIRREVAAASAAGSDWRAVIDSLRPETAKLWQGLTDRDRARFLRHLRPFWDVHRHRMAPPVAAQIAALRRDGILQVIRGRLLDLADQGDSGIATIRPRGGQARELAVQRVISATGAESVSRCGDRLLHRLLDRGLARLDSMGLGLQVSEALQVIDADGRASSSLWALGPVVRGMFWECTAVPDIRVQAARLAQRVAC